LAAAALDDYVGRYELGGDFVLTVSRDGDGLKSAIGLQSFPMSAEAKDAPDQPMLRRIMQRDATGVVTGMVSRRQGTDYVFRKTA
jgi:hypothetical protein